MSRALAQVSPHPEFSLTVLTGPDKGSVYKLMGPKITIGRASENDVSIPADVKISRRHAKITFTPTGIIITNLTDNNVLFVNGEPEKTKVLLPNSIIKIGETELTFNVNLPAEFGGAPNHPTVRPATMPQHPGINNLNAPIGNPNSSSGPAINFQNLKKAKLPGGKRSPVFYVVIGLIVIGFIWVLTDDSKKPIQIALRTDETVSEEIKNQEQQIQDLQDERAKGGRNTVQYQQAQTYFVQGLRDFKQSQYERAMEAFQACLSTFPNHSPCQRYHRLSLKKYNELVQYHMILGRRYKEQNQFTACRASFRNVMTMVKDSSSEIYKEARVNFNLCKEQLEDRY
jgi:hypothetical protein